MRQGQQSGRKGDREGKRAMFSSLDPRRQTPSSSSSISPALALMAAAILATGEPEIEICTRCGVHGALYTHCADGRVLCDTCRPSSSWIDYDSYDEDGGDEAEGME